MCDSSVFIFEIISLIRRIANGAGKPIFENVGSIFQNSHFWAWNYENNYATKIFVGNDADSRSGNVFFSFFNADCNYSRFSFQCLVNNLFLSFWIFPSYYRRDRLTLINLNLRFAVPFENFGCAEISRTVLKLRVNEHDRYKAHFEAENTSNTSLRCNVEIPRISTIT